MRRKREGLLALLRNKQDCLDWDNFNIVENLLVFCVMRERAVPKESGVAFGITVGDDDNSVCIVFKTDRAKDPLIRDVASPRPDYLILYGNGNTLILTIVEMKGKAPRNREHGIEQIKALKDLLARELSQNLPGRLRSKFKNSRYPTNAVCSSRPTCGHRKGTKKRIQYSTLAIPPQG